MHGLLYVIDKLGASLAQAEDEIASLRQQLAEALKDKQEPQPPLA